jgi:hypothetical protein
LLQQKKFRLLTVFAGDMSARCAADLQLSCCTHIIHLAELACLQTVLLLLVLLLLLLLPVLVAPRSSTQLAHPSTCSRLQQPLLLLLLVLLLLLLLLPVSGGATFFYPAGTPISSSSLLAPFYTSGWGGYW